MLTYLEMSQAFAYEGSNSQAVLLIHGFLASPYIMRSMAQVFQTQGYTVQSILLPGHGTDFNDLRTVKFNAWQQTVNEALQALKAKYQKVIIVGFSLGAILGLTAAFEHQIDQLVLLCPAFQISKGAQILNTLTTLHLGFLLPDLFCTQSEKVNFGSYRLFPAFSVVQVYQAIAYYRKKYQTQTRLPKIYVAASPEDTTVEFEGVKQAMREYPQGSHFRIYSNHPATLGPLPSNSHEVIDVRQFDKVQAFSHVALPVSPDDPYFGIKGTYYQNLPEQVVFGEPTWKDKGKPVKRLTYNPDFAAMVKDILNWLQG